MSRRYGIHFGYWGDAYAKQGPEACLRQAKAAGASCFEFFPTQAMFEGHAEELHTLRRTLDELDIEPLFTYGYPPDSDLTADDRASRVRGTEHLKRGIEALGRIGARTLGGILYANWPARYDGKVIEPDQKARDLARVVAGLREVAPAAADNGVTLCLEVVNRFEHYLMNTAAEGMAVVDAVGHANCKLLLDVFHMNIEEDDIPSAIERCAGYIGHFHLSQPNRRVPTDSIRMDWRAIGRALDAAGYGGCVVLEPFVVVGGEQGHNMRMWRNLEPDVSLDGRLSMARRGIAFIQEQLEGRKS